MLCPNMIIAHHLNSIIGDYDLTFSCGSISFYLLPLPLKNKPKLLAFLPLEKIQSVCPDSGILHLKGFDKIESIIFL